jgi:hypothetical protein
LKGLREWRRRLRLALWGPALVFLGWSSCAWRVIPPVKVTEPVPVFVTEYGRHTRLALPSDSTAFVEYGFGEWNFYGLEKQGWLSALRAISGLGQGALSRRELPFSRNEADFLQAAGGARSARLWVERSSADDLRQVLEARWRANAGTAVIRQADQIFVSHDPAPYHLLGNSNHEVANWLERLGCRVHGNPITSNFEITKKSDVAGHRAPRPPGGETPW